MANQLLLYITQQQKVQKHLGCLFFYLMALLITSCTQHTKNQFSINNSQVKLVKVTDSSYVITATTDTVNSTWPLPYPVYRFTHADINGDGKEEILVGVSKITRFDSVVRKRIFIFKLFNGYVRPMWLGSRVGQPLEDFRVITLQGKNRIRTIEYEQDGSFLVAEYQWQSFGLHFIRYISRFVDRKSAEQTFNKNI